MGHEQRYFPKNQPFHIVSRAVANTKIFQNDSDCHRFIFQIQASNIGNPAANANRYNIKKAAQQLLQGKELDERYIINRHKPFVHIFDFALVKTHYHFYLASNIDNGVIPFMHKLNMSFAKYFNVKHERKGAVFSGTYKFRTVHGSVHSDTVRQYVSIINSLDIFQPKWREAGITEPEKALEFLKTYTFSSFQDNIGERNAKFLAPKNIKEKFGLIQGEKFLNASEYFLKKRAIRPFLTFVFE